MALQLHKVLWGIILVGLAISGIIVFLSSGVDRYGVSDYDNESLETFNAMSELSGYVEEYDETTDEVDPESTADILGSFFTSAYKSAKTLKKSGDVLVTMADEGVDNANILGGWGSSLKTGLIALILIGLTVGIFLHFITKSERT